MRHYLRGPFTEERIEPAGGHSSAGPGLEFASEGHAAAHLRSRLADPGNAEVLRRLVQERVPTSVQDGTDEHVVQRVASALMSGSLRLVPVQAFTPPQLRWVPTQPAPVTSVSAPVRRAPRPSQPVKRTQPAPPAAPSEGDVIDQQNRQAETLEAAARDGTPFCEECEKRKRSAA